ncbi:ferredoxin [Candidatus Uhrbacteria bacterium]|jgi:ferredoxin|nr:ferredoxin [Candidatus Uhrbacteria bacterium]
MKFYKITHDRPSCIGCGSCEYEAPKFWKLDEEDGLSTLIGGKSDERYTTLEIDEMDYEENKNACDNCPVNVIRIDEMK